MNFSYNGYTSDFTLRVIPATLEITLPTKVIYRVGEKLKPAGMSVVYNEGNGTTRNIELYDLTITPSWNDTLTLDDTRVEVALSFGEDDVVKGYFDITVSEEG